MRDIVVFERDARYTESGKDELGFRLHRSILPAGSSPVAIVNDNQIMVIGGQWFTQEEIIAYIREVA
ncbi:hypothetical protein M0R72_06885 [Candidatus Pacearchaeota archaeon]|jgi:hypothetical protein|nr:hypothetical protein [Candidatus Pacearchaeota archaeon]